MGAFVKVAVAQRALSLGVLATLAIATVPAVAQNAGSPGFNYAQPPQQNPYSPQGMPQVILFQLKAVREGYQATREGCIKQLNQQYVDLNIYHCAFGGYALDPVTKFPKTDPWDDAFVEIGQCVGAINDATGMFQSKAGAVEQACRDAQTRAGKKPNDNLANACWPQLHQAATTADRAFVDYPRSVDAGNRDRAQAAAELRQASDCIKQEVIGNATFDSYMAMEAKSMSLGLGAWVKALNPEQLAEFLAAAAQAGIPQQLLAQLQSGAAAYPTPAPYNPQPQPQPPAPNAVPYDPSQVDPTLQKVSEFSNRMRAAAESILQAVGRISKAMTDANDVTKHNNVGIGVAFTSMFGAASQMMRLAASQYQALAAVGHAAGDEAAVMQIADAAASQSQIFAGQVEQTATELGAAEGAMADATFAGTEADSLGHYLENAVTISGGLAQSDLPTCGLMSCVRLSQLLGKDTQLFEVFAKGSPRVFNLVGPQDILGLRFGFEEVIKDGKKVVQMTLDGGLSANQIQRVLQRLGIQAEVGGDFTTLMNEVRAGNPVIAGVKTITPPTNYVLVGTMPPGAAVVNVPGHAVVIEAAQEFNGVAGLRIYDPNGFVYWQPVATFQKYFRAYVAPK